MTLESHPTQSNQNLANGTKCEMLTGFELVCLFQGRLENERPTVRTTLRLYIVQRPSHQKLASIKAFAAWALAMT